MQQQYAPVLFFNKYGNGQFTKWYRFCIKVSTAFTGIIKVIPELKTLRVFLLR